jgi:hypothetical protein
MHLGGAVVPQKVAEGFERAINVAAGFPTGRLQPFPGMEVQKLQIARLDGRRGGATESQTGEAEQSNAQDVAAVRLHRRLPSGRTIRGLARL